MPTLDQLMQRSRIEDPIKATVAEMVRLGFRGGLDPEQAADVIATGRLPPISQDKIVAEYQRHWKPDLDAIALRTYGREAKVDGVIGQATLDSVLHRTCGVPDRQYAADGTLIPMDARWPDSCLMDVRIRIESGSYGSGMGLSFDQFCAVYDKALAHIMSFGKIGLKRVTGAARVTVDFENLGGSVLAWSHLANNDCGAKQQRFTRRQWTESYLFLVAVHECLHLCGCPHTPGNYIMNPSIITSLTGMTDRDVQNLLSQGYAKADPPTEPPPEDPTDPPKRGFACRVETTDGQTILAPQIKRIAFNFNG